MSTLLYRGHTYDQHKDCAKNPAVQLTYRRQVYQTSQSEEHSMDVQLQYRGVAYTHQALAPF